MKVRPLVIVMAIGVLILAAYGLFGVKYIQQWQEQEALASHIALVGDLLEGYGSLASLEQQRADAEARLAAEEASFPTSLSSTEVFDAVLQLAQASRVEVVSLRSHSVSTERVGEHDYAVLRLNISVEGSFSQLLTFLNGLERIGFGTLILEDANITESGELYTVGVDLAVYAQSLPQTTVPPGSD